MGEARPLQQETPPYCPPGLAGPGPQRAGGGSTAREPQRAERVQCGGQPPAGPPTMWFQSNCPKILLQHKPRAIHSPATDQLQSYRINGLHTPAGLCVWPTFCRGRAGQDKELGSYSPCGPLALWWGRNSALWASEGLRGSQGPQYNSNLVGKGTSRFVAQEWHCFFLILVGLC